MLRARDVMSRNVISVQKDTPILEAVKLLVENNISGLPVVEDDMTLVGILTEKDILRLFYALKDAENKTVSDFMTQPAVHFNENESLLDICDCLMNNPFRRVPVTSKGKVIGIISRQDFVEYILRLRRESVSTVTNTK